MSEFEKIIITAALSCFGSWLSVLLGYWLTTHSANRKARRKHKTQLRFLFASFPLASKFDTTKQLDEWWLHAVDDCGWLSRRRIEQWISEFRKLNFPVPDWDVNIESEYTPEVTVRYQQQLDEANNQAKAILDQIIKRL